MAKPKQAQIKSNYLAFSIYLGLVTLFLLPSAMDPFLMPKAAILIVGSIWFFSSSVKHFRFNLKDPLQVLLLLLAIWFLLLLVVSDYKWISLFGVNGRATGIIFYLALIGLMWYTSKFEFVKQKRIYSSFGIIGLLVLFYGLLQYLNLDPYKWNLVYKGIIGVFGNPNFMGAFSALVGIYGFSLGLNRNSNAKLKLFGLLLVTLSLINIYASKATQGFVSLAIGIAPILVFLMFIKAKSLGFFGLGVSATGLLLFLAGLFQVGPLTEIAYKQSVSYRGDFWRTAFNMIRENPVFGVGFERFGVNYRSYRDLPQVLRNGADAYSDNAHNIYLQFAATGGLMLALLYLALNVFIVINFVNKLKTQSDNSYFYVAIFGIWLAIQAQSLISVDTPGIALWGWVFAGFLCANPENKESTKSEISPAKIVGAVTAMAFSVLSIFQFNAQTSMRNAFYLQIPKSNQEYADAKAEILQNAQNHEPWNAEWPILSANSLIQDEAYKQTLEAAKRAVKLDPKDYRGWYFLATAQEKLSLFNDAINSREAAKKIDPYNAENLLNLGRDYKAINKNEEAKQIIAEIQKFAADSSEYQTAIKELN